MTEPHPIIALIESTFTEAEMQAMPTFVVAVREGSILGGPKSAEATAELLTHQTVTLVEMMTAMFPGHPNHALGLAARMCENIMKGVHFAAYEGRPDAEFIADMEMINAANMVRVDGFES